MPDWFDVVDILHRNTDKDFVKRIIDPDKYPRIDIDKNKYKTHEMVMGESDGKYYVYPTIVHVDGKLKQLSDIDAWRYAVNNNEMIEFDDPIKADWFSKNYKLYWKK